jgi:excisionase family DNA binding protein
MAFLLTVAQAAGHMGIPQRMLYRLIRQNLFPAVHLGRSIRVHRGQMLEFMDSGGRKLLETVPPSADNADAASVDNANNGPRLERAN